MASRAGCRAEQDPTELYVGHTSPSRYHLPDGLRSSADLGLCPGRDDARGRGLTSLAGPLECNGDGRTRQAAPSLAGRPLAVCGRPLMAGWPLRCVSGQGRGRIALLRRGSRDIAHGLNCLGLCGSVLKCAACGFNCDVDVPIRLVSSGL